MDFNERERKKDNNEMKEFDQGSDNQFRG